MPTEFKSCNIVLFPSAAVEYQAIAWSLSVTNTLRQGMCLMRKRTIHILLFTKLTTQLTASKKYKQLWQK
jgi:hypothetical protein